MPSKINIDNNAALHTWCLTYDGTTYKILTFGGAKVYFEL